MHPNKRPIIIILHHFSIRHEANFQVNIRIALKRDISRAKESSTQVMTSGVSVDCLLKPLFSKRGFCILLSVAIDLLPNSRKRLDCDLKTCCYGYRQDSEQWDDFLLHLLA